SSRARGKSIVRSAGNPNIALGNNAAVTTAIAFLTTVSAGTLVRTTVFASTACPFWLWADTRASSTEAIGSVPLTRGRNTGGMTGTTTTTFTLSTSTTAITCTTAGIPMLESRSASRCNGAVGAASKGAAPDRKSEYQKVSCEIRSEPY